MEQDFFTEPTYEMLRFWRPLAPSMLRRSKWHDYRSRCMYLVTFKSNQEFGYLSRLSGSSTDRNIPPVVECTRVGMAIAREFARVQEICPSLKITNRVFMPDHIHFILYAMRRLEETISFYMGMLKGRCTRAVWRMEEFSHFEKEGISVWQPGFNDKILYKSGQLQRFIHYIEDNPRRLLITRDNPGFFHNTHKLLLGETVHDAYGNLNLINHPVRDWVVVRRHYTPAEREKYYNNWREVTRQGGVLIGPFVSPAEQKIKWGALKAGAKVIEIREQGFPERYKPGERELPYCASGQLLQIGFREYSTRKQSFDRALCLQMNEFAKEVAALSLDQIRYL